jgi:hypothetical protein
MRPSRVQHRILESIEEWRQTICQTSRYKEDLGFIRDMHRLLLYKGYAFPEVRREDAAVLNPSDVRVLLLQSQVTAKHTNDLSIRIFARPRRWKRRRKKHSLRSFRS